MKKIMSLEQLHAEHAAHAHTGATSGSCRTGGFRPAFYDFATATLYLSRFADGRIAPLHLLEGLPQGLVAKGTLVSGFERGGYFYTRTATARACEEWRL